MKNRIFWGLVALNVVLLFTLIGRVTSSNTAVAQVNRPSDYIMIPGAVAGQTGAVVYMLDTGHGILGAMTYDDTRKNLISMPPIDLARVFGEGAGAGKGAGTGYRK